MPASAAAAAVIPPPTEPTGPAPDLLLRFEEAAARHPHREAVVAPDGESLDFATLATRVRTLAAALRGAGIRPGQPVGVAIGRGPALLTALLAAWHAGAAYVPLDPAHPQERLHHMVTDAGITVVVADPAAGVSPPPGVRLLDPAATASSGADHRQPSVHVPVGAPAYVIYTSGSTGRPKGVAVPRGAAARLVAALEESGSYAPDPGRVAWNASVSFDASVQQWARVCRGDTLLLLSDELRADPGALAAYLTEQRATDLDTTPSHWSLLHRHVTDAARRLPGGIRLFVGGEPVPAAMWRDLAELGRTGTVNALNLYGPTECTVDATVAEVTGPEAHIGRPLPGVGALVLDDALCPAAEGELYLTGPGLAQGYLGRPALTAHRFTACPYGPPGARMYRTGDRVRTREDGCLDYLGRVDHQVKVNGFRVELGEIEAVLSAHPAVAAAVVTVRAVAGSAGHGSSLAAYWVPAPGSGQDPEPLRRHLAASLPDYLTRMSLTPLDALPLAVGGKVDRAALPDPGEQPDSGGAGPAGAGLTGTPLPGEGPEPTGEVEPLIAAAWQEILGRERVLVTDDFFDLGGHSLLALRVVANLKKHLGVVIPTRLVYQHPKLRDLARTVADHAGLAPAQDAR
ncbi:non-ribosomal peptide synthetase [Streptomyces sp. ZYX-F-203]